VKADFSLNDSTANLLSLVFGTVHTDGLPDEPYRAEKHRFSQFSIHKQNITYI
jgi:hypothetical protein